ncbi:hypothetical protein NE555_16895, partial [Alistipes onderdonkii]|nr:hypothetical protein [Alistipes onderdonkii]
AVCLSDVPCAVDIEPETRDFSRAAPRYMSPSENTKPNDSYTFEGASLLVDGYHSRPVFTSGAWLGYPDEPLDVTIDMGGEQSYRSVELETLAEKGDWIF